MPTPDQILGEVYAIAADYIEGRTYTVFNGGPQVFTAIHTATWDLLTGPASEGVRRLADVPSLDRWSGSQAEAVALLRKTADAQGPMAHLREEFATGKLEDARRALVAEMGWEGSDVPEDVFQLALAAGEEVARLRAENERLTAELHAVRATRYA